MFYPKNSHEPFSSAEIDYCVMLKTGDDKDAGTDANVYLQMFGEKGKTHNFSLREEGDKRRFERGRMDKFLIRTKDIGPVSYRLFHPWMSEA